MRVSTKRQNPDVAELVIGRRIRTDPLASKGYALIVRLESGGKKGKKPQVIWSEWQDLNLRPLRPERSALPG